MNEEFEAGSQHWICPTRPQMTLVQTNNVPLNLLLDDIWAHAISRYSSPLPLSKIPPKPYRIPRWAVHVPSGPTKGELHAWSISTCGQWPRDNNRRSLCSTLKSTSLDGILYLGWGHDRIWYTIINQGAWKQWNRNVRHMCNDSPHWCKMDRRREKKNVSFHDFSFEPTMETSGQCVCQQNTYLNLMRPHHLFQWVLYLGSWSPGQHPSQRLLQIIPCSLSSSGQFPPCCSRCSDIHVAWPACSPMGFAPHSKGYLLMLWHLMAHICSINLKSSHHSDPFMEPNERALFQSVSTQVRESKWGNDSSTKPASTWTMHGTKDHKSIQKHSAASSWFVLFSRIYTLLMWTVYLYCQASWQRVQQSRLPK